METIIKRVGTWTYVLLFCVSLQLVIGGIASCTSVARKQAADALLPIKDALCIAAHAYLKEESIAEVCGIADELLPTVRRLAGEQRAASARVGACYASDGGAPDAGR